MTVEQAYRYMVKHSTHCVKCDEEDLKTTGVEAYQLNKDGVNIDVITRGKGKWIIGKTITPLDFSLGHLDMPFHYINIDYHSHIKFWETHKYTNGKFIEIDKNGNETNLGYEKTNG